MVTTNKYEQWLKQGHVCISELVDSEGHSEHPLGCHNLEELPNWSTDDLKGAFDRTPNCASPWVLALLIATKCFGEEERGKSMAWQIYLAFKQFWEQAFIPLSFLFIFGTMQFSDSFIYNNSDLNGTYQGCWVWDGDQQQGHGVPAVSLEVERIIQAMKNREGAKGMCSHHCAMKKEYMDIIIDWSNKQCPPLILKKLESLAGAQLHNFLPLVTKHFFMHAFSASGWNLWTMGALTSFT